VREADIQLYAIGIFESGYHRRTLTELNGPLLLSELTELTGGRAFHRAEIRMSCQRLPPRSAQKYTASSFLGYQPSNKTRDARLAQDHGQGALAQWPSASQGTRKKRLLRAHILSKTIYLASVRQGLFEVYFYPSTNLTKVP